MKTCGAEYTYEQVGYNMAYGRPIANQVAFRCTKPDAHPEKEHAQIEVRIGRNGRSMSNVTFTWESK